MINLLVLTARIQQKQNSFSQNVFKCKISLRRISNKLKAQDNKIKQNEELCV